MSGIAPLVLSLGLIAMADRPTVASHTYPANPTGSQSSGNRLSIGHQDGRPSLGFRWTGAGSQNQVSFAPAPPFLFLLGLAGPTSVAAIMVRRTRTM